MKAIFLAFIAITIVQWVIPSAIPFGVFEFWNKTSVWMAIKSSWILFISAIILVMVIAYLFKCDPDKNNNPRMLIVDGFFNNIATIIIEEILLRWLLFLNIIWIIKLLNWLIFGWLGFGILEWFYINLPAPIISLSSFGMIDKTIVYNPLGWFVGASVATMSIINTSVHKNQGILGMINCWFIELYLFYVMFQFGLLACIAIHFLYNTIIHFTQYLIARKQKQ